RRWTGDRLRRRIHGRRQIDPARALLVRTGVRPVARLRGSRSGHAGRPLARSPGQPPPGAAQAYRCVHWPGERPVRSFHLGRSARFPAIAVRERRRHRRAAHTRRALRRGRRVSASDPHGLFPRVRSRRGPCWRLVVSSILDALEKLERSRPPTPEGSPQAPAEPRRRRTVALAGAAFAVGAAAAVTLFLLPAARTPVAVPPPAPAKHRPPPGSAKGRAKGTGRREGARGGPRTGAEASAEAGGGAGGRGQGTADAGRARCGARAASRHESARRPGGTAGAASDRRAAGR